MWWPSGIYKRWRNSRIMNRYLGRVLEERLSKQSQAANERAGQKSERKCVIVDLALQEYHKQQPLQQGQATSASLMDEKFKEMAITQIRSFIFAGEYT